MDGPPDYSQYSVEQLSDVLAHGDLEKFPDRYALVVEEFEKRLSQQTSEARSVESVRPIPELVPKAPSPMLQLWLVNAAEYGSMVLLGIVGPIYSASSGSSDMPIELMLVPTTVILFVMAAIGFGCMRHNLRNLPDQNFALRQSLIALFWAPPCLIGGAILGGLANFFIPPLFPLLLLCFLLLCFVLPFVLMTIKAKKALAPR